MLVKSIFIEKTNNWKIHKLHKSNVVVDDNIIIAYIYL